MRNWCLKMIETMICALFIFIILKMLLGCYLSFYDSAIEKQEELDNKIQTQVQMLEEILGE